MSLPAREQRALDGIEIMLQAGEVRLQSMFVLFTSLSKDEEKPRTEDLGTRPLLPLPARRATGQHARNSRRRSAPRAQQRTGRAGTVARVTLVLFMIAMAAVFSAVLISALGARTCGPAATTHSSAPAFSPARTCPPAPAPHRN